MWPVFRHCFRLLLKMREKQHFQWEDSGNFQTWVQRTIGSAPFLFLLFYWRIFCQVEIWLIIYDKNNLRIDFKHCLTCFYELLWYFFDFSSVCCEHALFQWIAEQNAPTKRRFLVMNMDFIEQTNIYWVNGSLVSANIWRSSKVSD